MTSLLSVCEIFTSLQGEGLHTGLPCFFIRLSGCNLACCYCDTRYAHVPGELFELSDIIDMWKQSQVSLVQITGGEPLLQQSCYELMRELLKHDAAVLLETNGSRSLRDVPCRVVKIVDMKTPGSGMSASWHEDNVMWLAEHDQVKFVITCREDYEWACERMKHYGPALVANVLFSPAWGMIDPAELASWVLKDRLEVRFQLQLHKVLWGEKTGC